MGKENEGGIGEFSVTASKHVEKSAPPETQPASRSQFSEEELHWHYIVLLPPICGHFAPIHFNSNTMGGLKEAFRITFPVSVDFELEGQNWQLDDEIVITGHHIVHPDSLFQHLPCVDELGRLAKLVEEAISRSLDHDQYLARLNRMRLPIGFRNLARERLFEGADASPEVRIRDHDVSARSPESGDSDIEALLRQIEEKESPPKERTEDTLQQLIGSVGEENTGFTLKESSGRAFLALLRDAIARLQAGMLLQESIREMVGLLVALKALGKKARERAHQHVHLVPWGFTKEDMRRLDDQWDWQGKDVGVAFAMPSVAGNEHLADCLGRLDHWARRWNSPLFVQMAGHSDLATQPKLVQDLNPNLQLCLFAGAVVAMLEQGQNRICFFKPACLAYVEALLMRQGNPAEWFSQELVLEDQDVFAAEGPPRSTHRLFNGEEYLMLRQQKVNLVNGVKNRDCAVFGSLQRLGGS